MAEAVFKKVFKGYDTKQVDEFIVSLSDTYAQNEQELAARLHELTNENERLRDEIAELKDELDDREREHIEELEESRRKTDELCAEIGEKMVVAEKEAAIIITDAKKSSENEVRAIRARAEEEAARLIAETKRKCESITAAAEEIRARQNEVNKSLLESESRLNDALSKLSEDIGDE